jgi:glucose/arabinose dehydrogenase
MRPLLFVAALITGCLLSRAGSAALVDPAFTETFITTGTADITSIEWAPDGSQRLFFLRKSGEIRIIENWVTLATPFATVTPLITTSECGLLGIAFDPDFVNNQYVYVFATVSATEQQIIRYTANGNVGEDKTVIVAGLPTLGANHDGGALTFGPDGKLYWAIGDNGNRTGVQKDLTSLAAKVGRANRDGSVPEENPFYDGDGPHNDYIWATGFRNPFTMAWQPATGRLWLDVVGAYYEQVFMPQAGDNGGWNLYEANQPTGYIEPVISYMTATASARPVDAAGAMRVGGVATFTTTEPHRFQRGAKVTITGVTDATFNGTGFVSAVLSPTVFSLPQAGPDATSGQGIAASQLIGGVVTGATFWDSSAVPLTHRGNFFFSEYGFGRIVRATLDDANHVTSVDEWANQLTRVLDLAVGPDGDLYYARLSGNVYHAAYNFVDEGIVVSRLNVRVAEGGGAVFSVRLTAPPKATRTVVVNRMTGDADVTVAEGASLDFTPEDWNIPQRVLVNAAQDPDSVDDLAHLRVSSPGLGGEQVTVRVTDDDESSVLVSPAMLTLGEGETATLEVSLSEPPSADREVTVALESGESDVNLPGVAPLTFSSKNWSTPQLIEVTAAQDADVDDDSASLAVSSSGLPSVEVPVIVKDDDGSVGAGGAGAGTGVAGQADTGGVFGANGSAGEGGQSTVGLVEGGEGSSLGGAGGDLHEASSHSSSGCSCSLPSRNASNFVGLTAAACLLAFRRVRRRSPLGS